MRRDPTATVPTAKSLELPINAYTNGGIKLESAQPKYINKLNLLRTKNHTRYVRIIKR